MKNAILAIEDTRFREHMGVDLWRVGGAVLKNVLTFSRKEGASTLTQQVARTLYLKTEKTWTRKFRNCCTQCRLNATTPKTKSSAALLQHGRLGGGAYGFEAAADYYFSKSVKDLTLEECAMLAAVPKPDEDYNPARNPKATTRRNLVLGQWKGRLHLAIRMRRPKRARSNWWTKRAKMIAGHTPM
ncbi:MAG: biosynthetic peptidoglycan transglycosylase [Blastocatellia bacterium]